MAPWLLQFQAYAGTMYSVQFVQNSLECACLDCCTGFSWQVKARTHTHTHTHTHTPSNMFGHGTFREHREQGYPFQKCSMIIYNHEPLYQDTPPPPPPPAPKKDKNLRIEEKEETPKAQPVRARLCLGLLERTDFNPGLAACLAQTPRSPSWAAIGNNRHRRPYSSF